MNHLWTEAEEKEIYQQITEAIEQAKKEGQPVQEIYKAIQAGAEVKVRWETAGAGKVQLIIFV